MTTRPLFSRLLGRSILVLAAAGPASSVALAHDSPVPDRVDRPHSDPHGPVWHPGSGALPDGYLYRTLGIDIRPSLEHWQGNYRPDSYRLQGYDGEPAGRHVCHGEHGRTLSSAGTSCPPGQSPPKGGRHLSTDRP
ncbi:hypothetical protein [Salinisphaera sp. Q1T1-3]|uniref:hypothetical protein n=1 Tax=Salinisphaera sp. Q1T1-3 TaxID=2321229 RepID=UPI000E73B298|nr:hypothetical protein [Salinisphaera sp. Q1T1-3]RJS95197.1 hypothetical protein D3260_01170 [Salinisphaera sp. Q1T1-3]